MNKKIKNGIIGTVVGALTGGIGGYLYGAKQTKKEMALEAVDVLESDVTEAAGAAIEEVVEETTQA